MAKKKSPTRKRSSSTVLILGSLAVIAFAAGWLYSGGGSGDATPVLGADGQALTITMYKNPSCACCDKWVEHLERSGFEVETVASNEMHVIKQREGIDASTASCHTAFVDGYVIEGHVPARDIKRLLQERPSVKGLAVPGMPMGAPGMEGNYRDPYDVVTFDGLGNTTVWSSY